jgi:hypothetical protein
MRMSALWREWGEVGSGGRRVPDRRDLNEFNRQVLACQNQAFTLACSLLGNEPAADAVVSDAVRALYAQFPVKTSILPQLLHEVLRRCERGARPKGAGVPVHLRRLPARECRALLLVDVLGLCYDEAAEVLGCSRQQLAAWLASGRQRLVEEQRAHGSIGASA